MTPLGPCESEHFHSPELTLFRNTKLGEGVRIMGFTNIYDCDLGEGVFVGPFVELGGVIVGARTKISSHSYIPPGCELGTDCFVAHGVKFCNDTFTKPSEYHHISELNQGWVPKGVKVGSFVRIGSNAVLMAGVEIGDHAVIGAGAVVTRNVGRCEVVAGVPARVIDTTSNPWEQFS